MHMPHANAHKSSAPESSVGRHYAPLLIISLTPTPSHDPAGKGSRREHPPHRRASRPRGNHTEITHLPTHVDRLRVPTNLRSAAPAPPNTIPIQRAPADAHVAILVVDGVAVAGGHGHPRVRRLCTVGPSPEVVSVRGLGLVVDHPGGGVTEFVQQRLSRLLSVAWEGVCESEGPAGSKLRSIDDGIGLLGVGWF